MIGKLISHYKILEELGRGGMGTVYKAQDTKLDRFAALKFLPPHLSQDEEGKKRFMHEAKAASALDHPNICTIYEIGEAEDGQMFIAMACYEGESLKEKIERGPLPIDEALLIATQIAEGLAKAHEKQIIHRDIKPANILVTEERVVKIVDFGLAKLAGRSEFTKEGTTLGTAAYMSPEQAQSATVDHRTDIWALGTVLYEMVTGRQAFQAHYEQAVIYSIMHEEVEPPTALSTGVPEELERIILKAMTKEPAARYQNVEDMLVDLKAMAPSATVSGLKTKPEHVKWPGSILIAGFAVVALVATLATILFNSSESDWVATKKSIAVLPFTDMSPQKDQEYFGDGMAETVINALARIPGLKVSARTSAFQFKGGGSDIQAIGKKLGVSTVLEGSVAKSGNSLRVTAQLINVADGFHLWSDTYDRKLTDIFAIQDDLSRSIVAALKIKLSDGPTQPIQKSPAQNVEAYSLYLRGRYLWNKRTEEGLKKSIDYFQEAINLDSTFALAYAGLADVYIVMANWQFLETKEAYTKAKHHAQKALELDDSLAEAHTALAKSMYQYDWDWMGAERGYKRAITLNPNYATARQWYATYLGAMGRHDEARSEIQKALELDPLSLIINGVSGWLHQMARQDNEAIKQLTAILEMNPHFTPAHNWLIQSYRRKGMHDESFEHFMSFYPEYYGLTSSEKETLKIHYEETGWTGVATFMLARLAVAVKPRGKYASSMDMSIFFATLNDHEKALDHLEEAYRIRSPEMVYIAVVPAFDALHSRPRFQYLMEKVGLAQ